MHTHQEQMPFKFIPISDTHGDLDRIKQIPEQKDCTVLLAGDIHEVKKKNKYKEILSVFSEKFKNVVLICGNHEYYTRSIFQVHNDLEQMVTEFDNVYFLNDSSIIIDGVHIIGSTLWTDFNDDIVCKIQAQMKINDYRYIRNGPKGIPYKRKLTIQDVEFSHYISKTFIKNEIDNIQKREPNARIVIMTHHAPSFQSVPLAYKNSILNGAFASNMDSFLLSLTNCTWVHGHIHDAVEYTIGTCRVISNPLGHGPEQADFKDSKYFVI